MNRPGLPNATPPAAPPGADVPTGTWSQETPPGTPPPTMPTRVKPPAKPAPLKADDELGAYRILKPLGEGGMGVVYKGWDVNLRRPVALKVLRPEVATDPTARSRFVREAQAAAAVQHDHVVTIHQVGEANGVPFIAMQYLHGTPLDRFLVGRGPGATLDPPLVMRVGREVAAGLAAAHALGLVHRDIKPSNVWLEAPKGRVKLLDFGIAKQTQPEPDARGLTEPGMVMGTPAYMSPEQARGWATDPRSDLFSLGAVLYELCTGSPPFLGTTVMETLTALAQDDPEPIAAKNPAVPPALAALIGQLLAKEPAARPQTASEVASALRQIERDLVAKRSAPQVPPADGGGVMAVSKPTDVLGADDPGYEVIETGAVPAVADPDFEVVADGPREGRRPKRNRRGAGKRSSRGLLVLAVAGGVALGGLLVAGVVAGLTRGTKGSDEVPGAKAGPAADDRDKQWEAARPGWMPAGSPPPPWWQPGMKLPDAPPEGWQPGMKLHPPGGGDGPRRPGPLGKGGPRGDRPPPPQG